MDPGRHRTARRGSRLIVQPDALPPLQIEVAPIFFDLETSEGFLVAGGAALLACELITRPTEDLDIFASSPTTSVNRCEAGARRRPGATRSRRLDDPGQSDVLPDAGPTGGRRGSCRPRLDSPPHAAPTLTVLGPTLAPVELAGRKLLALFGRAETPTLPMSTCWSNNSARKRCCMRPSHWTQGSTAASSRRCSEPSDPSRTTRSRRVTTISTQPRPSSAPGSPS